MSLEQVHEYVRKKDEEKSSEIDMDDNTMLEEDDEEEELGDIPNSFHHLTDKHFPLFITYKKLSQMLQGTYGIDTKKLTTQQKLNTDYNVHDNKKEEIFQGSYFFNKINASWAYFVNYKIFQERYWKHFSDYHRQKLDCELVYSEFSVIKGLNPEVDYLSKEDYRAISTKKYPAFCHNRDQIYDLFQQYEKMKARNGDYDSIDRTLAILRCAKTKPLGGPHIHEVYIDECQDNHIVDFALILKIFDRADSIFFAGDTAQCIAQGSSFRFQDIRSLIYQWELNRTKINYNLCSMKPKQFELNVNYRSHNGILRLASSVIDLIWHFFPNSIDRLSRERGEIGGPLPIMFEEFQAETFHYNIFSVGEHASYVEFGAEQVIIVRNDAAKKRVKKLIGKVGLVMTVFEAKGMEFNDVLLYDFFTDSPARSKWRVILSALDDHSKGVQTFSHEKHYIL
ncbi:P-loop containing nucleoside triphosphate hydrolase protein, partial [Glomus cerebriforme]